MPLTPADVHNVAFSKPPIGKRGYNARTRSTPFSIWLRTS